MNDEDIKAALRKARSGDREALDQLLERLQDRLKDQARRRLGAGLRQRIGTSDVLQSTYLDVVKGIGRFEGEDEESFVAWVRQVMENNLKDKAKHYRARRRHISDGRVFSLDEARSEVAGGGTPSREAVRAEDLAVVSRALDALPDTYRRVLLMRMVEGKSHKEMGDVLGKGEAATRMLLSRARAALALELERRRRGS